MASKVDVERMVERHMKHWDGVDWDGSHGIALADFARVVMRACARVAALPARPMTHPKQAKVEKKYERVRWYEMGRADAAAAIRHAARKGRGKRGK